MRRLPFVAVLLATTLFAGVAVAGDDQGPGTITIQGRGEVTAAPDTAMVTSGVTTRGDTAREALDANTEAMDALMQALGEAGIEPRDIQTSNFTVSPNYAYSDRRTPEGYSLPPVIAGYVVSNNVSVRVRDLEILGAVLDRAVTVGANTIGGISFSVDDPSALQDEARARAMEDAVRKAEIYARAGGFSVGRIRTLAEGASGGRPPQPYMADMMAARSMEGASVPVQAGELSFAVDVTVVWEIAQDGEDGSLASR